MNFLEIILNMVFPARCICCGKNGTELCIRCLSSLPPAERESANWIFPLFDYRNPSIKKAIRLLKYKGKKRLARVFAEAMHDKVMEELADMSLLENFTDIILIPIPLSKKRKRERGYNQAELICQELKRTNDLRLRLSPCAGRDLNIKLEKNVLVKIKDTEHQANIKDRKSRLENLAGSFAVKNAEIIKGRNLILIDDVLTTGATLNEARKTLKKSGARKIIAFTVAH